jgi:hypothetical protein
MDEGCEVIKEVQQGQDKASKSFVCCSRYFHTRIDGIKMIPVATLCLRTEENIDWLEV